MIEKLSVSPCLRGALLSVLLTGHWAGKVLAGDWPAWRGPTGQGITTETDLPLHFGADENVKWKVPLPGPGNSTPIVLGRRVFLTQALEKGRLRALLALDRRDGKLLWMRSVEFTDAEPTHDDNPYASASPVTDGERVIVSYGSAGALAYSLDGQELWRKDLGKLHHVWGNAASPVIHGRLCILNCGPGERTSLLALDKQTGDTVWKVEIPGGHGEGDASTWTGSWSTPLVSPLAGHDELLVSYPYRLRAYRPDSGEEVWSCDGLGRLVYTSPLTDGRTVVAMSGFMGPSLAVRAGGRGDATAGRLWREEKCPQRIGSGVIAGERLYIVNESGVAECIELASGKQLGKARVAGSTWSSLLLAGDRLYVPDQSGDCVVFRADPTLEVLASNSLHETIRASIVPSDGELFIRGYKHLYCVGKGKR
jgi:outer membrane protein assembly factor BamB